MSRCIELELLLNWPYFTVRGIRSRYKLMHVHVVILMLIRRNFSKMWLRLPMLKQLGLQIRLAILLVKRIYVVCGRIILKSCIIRYLTVELVVSFNRNCSM